jgi:hypothetical protein
MGVDDLDLLAFRQHRSLALPGWNGDQRRRSHQRHSLVRVVIGAAHKIGT